MINATHKIALPQLPTHLVVRPRLRAVVDSIAARQLVLLTAPAGYGKTSLLLEWAHSANLPVCWYALDRFDTDPYTFLTCMGASLLHRFPERLPLTAALLQSGTSWTLDAAVATLGREIAELGQTVVVIFDDWHLVDHVPQVGGALSDLLRRAANFRAILASRSYPSVPNIMLLTAHGQVIGLAENQLRFSPEEAAAVLAHLAPRAVAEPEVANLTERANGWITAIVLMARAPELAAQAVQAIGRGSERRVYEFLTEQVFDQLDTELRGFLCASALLEDLQAEACDVLLNRQDSGAMLDRLLRQHLFVSEIEGGLLRYHPLFREFLLERYRRDDRAGFRCTALRIAEQYAAQGRWAAAFDLCLMGDDTAAAQAILARGGETLFNHGQLATLEDCFAKLPLDALSAQLLCLRGRIYLDRGATGEAVALADLAQARMTPEEAVAVRLFQARVAQSLGEYRDAITYAEMAIHAEPTDEQLAAALHISARGRIRMDEYTTATQFIEKALDIQRRRGNLYQLALLHQDLGMLKEQIGHLHDAERCYQQADAYWTTTGNIGARALSRNNSAVVLHMLGQYSDAQTQLEKALKDSEHANTPYSTAAIYASIGDIYRDLSIWELASENYRKSKGSGGSSFIQGYVDIAAIWIKVRQRQFVQAVAAIEKLDPRVRGQHSGTIALLQAAIASGQQRFATAMEHVNTVLISNKHTEYAVDVVLARVWEAHIVMAQGIRAVDVIVNALDAADAGAAALGHDAFLVAEFVHHPALLRRAAALGWERASYWIERVNDLRSTAQRISGNNELPVLAAHALGGEAIEIDGAAIELGLRKAREVFFYLLENPRGIVIDSLREAIWPDREEDSARHLLRTAIHSLRAALPADTVTMQGRRLYQLNLQGFRLEYDVAQFMALTDPNNTDPDLLIDGLEYYGGSYLPWCESEWSAERRSQLEQRFVQTLHRTAQLYEQHARHGEALTLYDRATALDPLDEAAAAGAMRCHIALGNRGAAIDSYQRIRLRLRKDLGLDPDPASELEHIYIGLVRA